MSVNRREFTRTAALAALGLMVARRTGLAQDKLAMVVYKSPTCGCCGKWVDHARASGFAVSVKDLDDMTPIKTRYKVPGQLQSCHTAVVGGYVIEGHVPAADIHRLLKEKPSVVGLTIPGMPQSAPGMDMKPHQAYEVLTFDAQGKTSVYAKH